MENIDNNSPGRLSKLPSVNSHCQAADNHPLAVLDIDHSTPTVQADQSVGMILARCLLLQCRDYELGFLGGTDQPVPMTRMGYVLSMGLGPEKRGNMWGRH